MARKSDGEKIDDLEKIVATLTERVDNVRNEMIDKERLAVVEQQLKSIQEASSRRWTIVPPLIAAVVGGVVGAVVTHALRP